MKKTLLILSAVFITLLVKAQTYAPYPVVPIDTVQFVSNSKLTRVPPCDSSDYVNPVKKNLTYGDTVRVTGIVMMDPRAYGLSTARKGTFIQRDSANGSPWSGVLILADPATTVIPASSNPANNTIGGFLAETKFYDNLKLGYKVRVTGIIRQFNITGTSTGETQIDMLHDYNANYTNSVELLSITPKTIPPVVMTVDSFMTGNPVAGNVAVNRLNGERYAGMYVELRNVTVYTRTASGANRWVWSVIDDKGNSIQIRDFSGYFRNDALEDTSMHLSHTFAPPTIGTRLAYIRGVITEASSNGVSGYWIAPLSPSDVGQCTICPPSIGTPQRNPVIASSSDSVLISVSITSDTLINSGKIYFASGYKTNVYSSVPMTKNGSIWSAKIPNLPADTVVKYMIKGTDARGISNDTALTVSYYLVVNGGITTIAKLQYSPFSGLATIWNNDSLPNINVTGIVTGINFMSGSGASAQSLLTMQSGTGPNSAIFIQRAATNDVTANWAIGDSVNVTSAKVLETFNVTTLNNISATKISSGNTLPPFAKNLPIDSFALNKVAFARPYEGVLIHFDSVKIFNPNPDAPSNFYEFSFAKDTLAAIGLRVDDMNASIHNVSSQVKKGVLLNYIQGPLFFSHNDFKLIPRSLSDIDLSHLDTIAPVITLKGKMFDTIYLLQSYVDSGATAFDNIDGNITSKIKRTGTVDSSKVGSNILTYSVSDNWGNPANPVNRYVYVKQYVSVTERELSNATVRVYPSPAQNQITVSVRGIQNIPVNISVLDMVGRELMTRQMRSGSFKEILDITNLNNGIYFCVLTNEKGSHTIKFVVSGK
ncbi:MAG: immunoglobulin-like domain-containing protein [Bacteroidia bacterium]